MKYVYTNQIILNDPVQAKCSANMDRPRYPAAPLYRSPAFPLSRAPAILRRS